MSNYPFLLLNPGELETQVNTTEDFFLWFARDLDLAERKPVMKGCPYPVNMVRHWGRNYVHFGSRNLGYQPDIVKTYDQKSNAQIDAVIDAAASAYRQSGILPDDDDGPGLGRFGSLAAYEKKMEKGLRVGYPRFVAAFDAWLIKAHNTVPVSFCLGPHRTAKSDAWSEWSRVNLATALDAYLRTRTVAFEPASVGKERRAHSFIFQIVLDQLPEGQIRGEQNEALLANLEMVFEDDGIITAFNRFESNDRRMTAQIKLLDKVLSVDSSCVQKLGPYTQLAYYAFDPGDGSPAVLAHADAARYVEGLVARFPPNRDRILLTVLLSRIASIIAQPRAGYAPLPADYAVAASILALATERSQNTSFDGYCWCTRIECLHHASLHAERDATILLAHERYAHDPYNRGLLLDRLKSLGITWTN